MYIRNIITTFLLLFLSCTYLQAQENNNDREQEEGRTSTDDEQRQTTATDTIREINYEVRIQQLEEQLTQCKNELAQNQQKLQEMSQQVILLQQKVNFGDTTAVRLANSILSRPLDEKRIDDAIMRLDHITTPELETAKQKFCKLLADYKLHFGDIIRILQSASADNDLRNPFRSRETAQGYIRQLHQTDYYRNIYKSEYIIPYLNDLIDVAITRFNKIDPARGETLILTDLIPKTK